MRGRYRWTVSRGRCDVSSFAEDNIALINRQPVSHLVRNLLSMKDGCPKLRSGLLRLRRVVDVHRSGRARLAQRFDPHMVDPWTQGDLRVRAPKNGLAIVRQTDRGQIAESAVAFPNTRLS